VYRGGACPISPEARVLHQRSAVRDQGTLPADLEGALSSGARTAQAPALLRGPPSHGGLLISVGGIIRNPDAAGRIAKWSVELMGETLAYVLR
jgi:hypothetical protein